jgi:uncharacterized protein
MRVGIISDTHGLLRAEAVAALTASGLIIHAGDVGNAEVIDGLRAIAPTFAVRGNVDTQPGTAGLPATENVQVGVVQFHVIHRLADLDIDPREQGIAAVIFGHSHKPSVEWHGGVLYLNPGSAGPRRFRLPVTIARVHVCGQKMEPEIVTLNV